MTGFSIFTANTDGFWKKFTYSFIIKIGTYFHLKKETKDYFGIHKVKDCPTHSICDGVYKGEQRIVEANKRIEFGYPYEPVRSFEFVTKMSDTIKNLTFLQFINSEKGAVYAYVEILNFAIRFFFRGFYKHSFFTKKKHCSELVANWIEKFRDELPNTIRELEKIDFNVTSPADLLNVALVGIKAGELNENRK